VTTVNKSASGRETARCDSVPTPFSAQGRGSWHNAVGYMFLFGGNCHGIPQAIAAGLLVPHLANVILLRFSRVCKDGDLLQISEGRRVRLTYPCPIVGMWWTMLSTRKLEQKSYRVHGKLAKQPDSMTAAISLYAVHSSNELLYFL
jgi:hypothetical protein